MSEELNKKRDVFQEEFIDLIVDTLGINQSDNLRCDLENIYPLIYGSLRDHFVDANEMVYQQVFNELKHLAVCLHRDFYSTESPEFELCDSILGVVSQIDNMVSGILEDKKMVHPAIQAAYDEYIGVFENWDKALGDSGIPKSFLDLASYIKKAVEE